MRAFIAAVLAALCAGCAEPPTAVFMFNTQGKPFVHFVGAGRFDITSVLTEKPSDYALRGAFVTLDREPIATFTGTVEWPEPGVVKIRLQVAVEGDEFDLHMAGLSSAITLVNGETAKSLHFGQGQYNVAITGRIEQWHDRQ